MAFGSSAYMYGAEDLKLEIAKNQSALTRTIKEVLNSKRAWVDVTSSNMTDRTINAGYDGGITMFRAPAKDFVNGLIKSVTVMSKQAAPGTYARIYGANSGEATQTLLSPKPALLVWDSVTKRHTATFDHLVYFDTNLYDTIVVQFFKTAAEAPYDNNTNWAEIRSAFLPDQEHLDGHDFAAWAGWKSGFSIAAEITCVKPAATIDEIAAAVTSKIMEQIG